MARLHKLGCFEKTPDDLNWNGVWTATKANFERKLQDMFERITIGQLQLNTIKKVVNLLEVVWIDVKGPLSKSLIGFHYFITFTNDKSYYPFPYLLQQKNEVFGAFLLFKATAER